MNPTARPVSRRLGLAAVLGAAAATSLVPASARADEGDRPRRGPLSTMTFNLRYAATTSPNSWADRRPVMRELLRRERPHVIGTQEGLYHQLQDIHQDLGPSYAWIGTGRMGGSRDEFMAVFYDTRRLAPVEYDHFWLSDTPAVIGSTTWGNTVVRMVTWVRFRDLADGREFYFLNTHFDHQSQNSRLRSAALVAERRATLDPALPLVVTGDFNVAAHHNEVYDRMLAIGLRDLWDTAERRGPLYATFHGYKGLTPDGERIDWILGSPGVTAHSAKINTFSAHGQFPSDHLPVQVTLTLG